jgi:hypothetical protein
LLFVLSAFGLAVIFTAALVVQTSKRNVPRGSAAIVTTLGQKSEPIVGPQKITVFQPLQHVEIHSLQQKPINLCFDCEVKNHIQIQLNITVVWELCPEGLLQIDRKSADPAELIKHLIESELIVELCCLSHAQLSHQVPLIAANLKRFVNLSENSDKLYHVKHVLITHIKLPVQIIHAATDAEVERSKMDFHKA